MKSSAGLYKSTQDKQQNCDENSGHLTPEECSSDYARHEK